VSEDRVALPALILGAVGIGFASVFAKQAVNLDATLHPELARLSPVGVAFWRMALAAPVFIGAALWEERGRGAGQAMTPAVWKWSVLWPGLFFALDLAIWHWAFEFTSVANATLEANLAVILVPAYAWLVMGERYSWRFVAGAALALAGMARLIGASFAAGGDAWIGDLLGVAVAFSYAGYQLSTKAQLDSLSPAKVMAWATSVCAAALLVVALVTPGRLFPESRAAWTSVVALALVAQVVGQGLIARGLKGVDAALASVVLIVQPLVSAAAGWAMLGQVLRVDQLAAGGVALLGIWLARRGALIRPKLPAR
jgi:drug/metabolite transporter (DMT)-like permease